MRELVLRPRKKPRERKRQKIWKNGKKNKDRRQKRYIVSRVVRKPAFCLCENKDADQLRGNRKADQRLCIRYIYSTIPLLSKSEILSL